MFHAMVWLVAPAVAVALAVLPADPCRGFRLPLGVHDSRRRLAGRQRPACLRFELMRRRQAWLHDFLIRARTETPEFRDARTYQLDVGVSLGPVVVTRDFVGSPIIRATLRNLTDEDTQFLLEAVVGSAGDASSGASAAVHLYPYEVRVIELLCPKSMIPHSLTWRTMPL